MKKATLTRLILYAASGIILAVTFSSCNFLLQMAQVRFNNQSSDTFTSVTFGNISQGTLTPGSTTSYQLIDSGTYTLNTSSGAGARTWPNDVTVEQPNSYTVVFFGTATDLGAEVIQD